jgi:hypothetical protein
MAHALDRRERGGRPRSGKKFGFGKRNFSVCRIVQSGVAGQRKLGQICIAQLHPDEIFDAASEFDAISISKLHR